ncbi:MAG: ATP-binding protein, partial [Saprospiraceae bacterium]
KWHYYKKRNNAKASNGNLFMAIVNVLFVTGCLLALIFDFYTPAGYWSYFIFIWFGNFLEVIVYINYAAVQTTVKTKLIGFTLVVQIMVLMAISLIFYPLLPPTEVDLTLTYQTGMYKILGIIIISVIILYVVFPKIIYLTITNPLEQLLKGVQNVNNGDLSTTVDISQNDEVGILTKNFNIMTSSLLLSQEKLVDYANTLEHKVTERTIQLQESLDNLKSTQSLLIQSEKLASLGELTAGIAHEIQNPLNFINNFSEVSLEMIEEIKEEREKPQDQIEHSLIDELFDDISENLKKIKNHGFRAESIVKGMLQHSRMSTGQREKTDINNLVDEYFRLAYHGLRAKDKGFNSILKPSYDKKIQKIEIVPQDIGRVVLNLFTNAFYAVNERKKQEAHDLLKVTNGQEESKDKYEPCVEVTTKWRTKRTESGENQEWIEIKVKDNGLGIPQNILEKIFQPFFTTKPAGQGTGLGLSLSYDIVKAHRGQLTVKTEVNHGTEFTIMLPAE